MSPILFGEQPLATAPAAPAPQPIAALAGGFAQPAAGQRPQAVLVPLNVPLPMGGDQRCYLAFGPECAAPQVLQQLLMELINAGLLNAPSQRGGGRGGFSFDNGYGNRGRGRGRW